MLTTQFEGLRIQKDDNIVAFNSKLRDIANNAFQLGVIYSKEKLVRKTLRSLPIRFSLKVAAVEIAIDVAKMTLDYLLGSLQKYEINLNAQTNDKGIALKDEVNSYGNAPYTEEEIMINVDTRNFGKLSQNFGSKSRPQNFIKSEKRNRRNVNKRTTEKHA